MTDLDLVDWFGLSLAIIIVVGIGVLVALAVRRAHSRLVEDDTDGDE